MIINILIIGTGDTPFQASQYESTTYSVHRMRIFSVDILEKYKLDFVGQQQHTEVLHLLIHQMLDHNNFRYLCFEKGFSLGFEKRSPLSFKKGFPLDYEKGFHIGFKNGSL